MLAAQESQLGQETVLRIADILRLPVYISHALETYLRAREGSLRFSYEDLREMTQ